MYIIKDKETKEEVSIISCVEEFKNVLETIENNNSIYIKLSYDTEVCISYNEKLIKGTPQEEIDKMDEIEKSLFPVNSEDVLEKIYYFNAMVEKVEYEECAFDDCFVDGLFQGPKELKRDKMSFLFKCYNIKNDNDKENAINTMIDTLVKLFDLYETEYAYDHDKMNELYYSEQENYYEEDYYWYEDKEKDSLEYEIEHLINYGIHPWD